GLEEVARELDYRNVAELRKELETNVPLRQQLVIKKRLLAEDGKILRTEWENDFAEAVRALKRGTPFQPGRAGSPRSSRGGRVVPFRLLPEVLSEAITLRVRLLTDSACRHGQFFTPS